MSRPAKRPKPDAPGVVEAICERLIAGESMTSIGTDPEMPSTNAIYVALANDDEFRKRIARAREAQQDAEIDRTIDLADSATPETVNTVKLQIWARQWRAAKLAPKRYGDKTQTEITGAEGGPLQVTVSYITPKKTEE